jgi:glycosyltransferase involved in cell wall biosynthesis
MERFSTMLAEGMKQRGHHVEVWTAKPFFFHFSKNVNLKKWLGYVDQYVVFPWQIRKRVKEKPHNTLFVFTDHALGPWIPLVANRYHVIHCHDFLAQLSALGKLPANQTSWTGKQYQLLIRKGFTKGKNFICVSEKTNNDLKGFVPLSNSYVVYNGLNKLFRPLNPATARKELRKKTGIDLRGGYILHVGGNQWYKNRLGVIEIYEEWRKKTNTPIPLLLIGKPASEELYKKYESSNFKTDIFFVSNPDDQFIWMAYSGASVFLFPSLMEGFGWPIAEAMACGSLVVTTNEPPMTEVAGPAAFLIPPRPLNTHVKLWTEEAAEVISKILSLSEPDRQSAIDSGIRNANRFHLENTLGQIENIYKNIMK